MKKIMSMLLAAAMVLTLSTGIVVSAVDDSIIAPCWNYMNKVKVDVNFSGDSGKLEATLTLYQQSGSDWIYVDSTSESSTRSLALTLDFNAESGATYKAVVEVTAYGNGGSETTEAEKIKTCP